MARSRVRPHAPAPPRDDSDRPVRWPWLALLTLAASLEVFRIGFFADDFHFLDVARRVPLLEALSGRWGIYPWYRPLSRELYFAIVSLAGPARLALAHALSIACLAASAIRLHRLAARFVPARFAAVAPALLVTYEFTRFLTAWASGFQDLLALLLILLAVDDTLGGRKRRAALWVLLAPLAKETGFIALPLALAAAVVCEGERRPRVWMALQAFAFGIAAALHAWVRSTWRGSGTTAVITTSPHDLLVALGRALAGFVGGLPAPGLVSLAGALVAAGTVVVLMRSGAARARRARAAPAAATLLPHGGMLAAIGVALGLAPLVAGNLLRLSIAHPYYAFPAVPWVALLATMFAARAPERAVRIALPALVAWNVLALGYRPPDLSSESGWNFRQWDWPEAIRLSAISRRLAADLREAVPNHPHGMVALYSLPFGTFFQTEDGPATREALSDTSVRGYFFNAPPGLIPRERLALLTFDPQLMKLVRDHRPFVQRVQAAASSLFRNEAAGAWANASWGDSAEYANVATTYTRSLARLLAQGPEAYRDELARFGLADSVGRHADEVAASDFGSQPGITRAFAAMLHHPLSADPHVALADSLTALGFPVSAGVELRAAFALDPARCAERLRLARLLVAQKQIEPARADLDWLVAHAPKAVADSARAERVRLGS